MAPPLTSSHMVSAHEFVDEDEGDGYRCHPTDEEEEGGEKPAGVTDGVVVRQFVDDEALGQPPADEKAEDDAAEGHNPQRSNVVEGIEEAATEEGTKVLQHAEGQRTE